MMRIQRWSAMTDEDRRHIVERRGAPTADPTLQASIAELVADVANRGDRAVCEALARFDRVDVSPAELAVSPEEFAAARRSLDPTVADAIAVMVANIRGFNEALLARRQSWRVELAPGHVVGEQITPVASAAVFCPSGKASYPSVLAQVATGAVVAGVPELIVVVPPVPGGSGEIDPAVLVVAETLGLSKVFRVNGPAGIAAAAFGTETIPKVGTIVGPGSPPVALAQLEVRRHGIDSVVLGPSESLVIADESVDVSLLAADLLNEAEHGPDGTVLLVTSHADLVEAVSAEAATQASGLPDERRQAVEASMGPNGGAIIVEDLDQAIDVANWFAPEHLQLAIADPEAVVPRITHAGEILIGQTTPFAAGNFCLGAPAALPTGGFARHAGGITVENFLKATSIGSLTPAALDAIAEPVTRLAEHEGFPAHAATIYRRQDAAKERL